MAGRLVPLLFYADDIVLLADNQAALTASLRVLEDYARKWRFQVNHGKSNVVVFGNRAAKKAAHQQEWLFENEPVEVVDMYKYLGMDFTNTPGRQMESYALPHVLSLSLSLSIYLSIYLS